MDADSNSVRRSRSSESSFPSQSSDSDWDDFASVGEVGGCRACELEASSVEVYDAQFTRPRPGKKQSAVAARLYTPIEPWETRLLTLRRGKGAQDLSATLDVATVIQGSGLVIKGRNERVPYFALSYTWGEARFDWSLRVNSHKYPVTENLFRALVRLSYSNRPVRIWIDAICISQHDPEEKSAHIRNIFSFFQGADTVVVWLGEHGQHTASTMRFSQDTSARPLSRSEVLSEEHAEKLSLGLHDLSRRKWFTRTWVRQEIWAARKLAFLCGNSVMSWLGLQNLRTVDKWLCVKSSTESLGLSHEFSVTLHSLEVASQEEVLTRGLGDYRNPLLRDTHAQRMDIVNVLGRTSSCICSDPLDRVYGVLGMTTTVVGETEPKDEEA